MSRPLLSVEDLVVSFRTSRGNLLAVDHVSIELEPGQIFGLVGESGSGKSVLGRSILRLYPAELLAQFEGRILFESNDLVSMPESSLRRVRGNQVAMIFQDASTALSPFIKIADQLTTPMRYHLGIRKAEARRRAIELLDHVGIADPQRACRSYPHQLSGGMRQRVMIAIALSCEPRVLIADEPTTALDVTIQAQVLNLLDRLRNEHELSVLLISHDLGLVGQYADEVAVIYSGRIFERAPADQLFSSPRAPYTHGLIGAAPGLDVDRTRRLRVIDGMLPDPVHLPPGCRFHPRCWQATSRCASDLPELEERAEKHFVACWNPTTPESSLTLSKKLRDELAQ